MQSEDNQEKEMEGKVHCPLMGQEVNESENIGMKNVESPMQDKKVENTVSQGEWQRLVKGTVNIEEKREVVVTPRGENVKVKGLRKVSMVEGTKEMIGQEKAKDNFFVLSPIEVKKSGIVVERIESCPWVKKMIGRQLYSAMTEFLRMERQKMIVKRKGKRQRVKEVLCYFLVLMIVLVTVKPKVKMK